MNPPLAAVAVARPPRGPFTYRVPETLTQKLEVGLRLSVPFGKGHALGFYLGPAEPPPEGARVRLRAIDRALEETPALAPDVVALLRFASEHYRFPLGEALKAALPPGLNESREVPSGPELEELVHLVPEVAEAVPARAAAMRAVVDYLSVVGGMASKDELLVALPGARAALARLTARGAVRWETRPRASESEPGAAGTVVLTDEQSRAVETLGRAVDAGGFSPFLLEGVTGSGKTEIYLACVERALERGGGGLVLVPEIALTPQLVGRFRARFGSKVSVLHSGMRDPERRRQFLALRRGESRIAVGVRSAVFAPVPDLRVVIVDEEHEPSFKQEDGLRYHARDLAVVRASQVGCTVVLGSATPSLETLHNVRRGRYGHLTLTKRVDDRPMPSIEVVDLRFERPKARGPEDEPPILSEPLLGALEETLSRGQQAIFFLNRRGFSACLLCETCGQTQKCDACDVALTLHRARKRLLCHYCGARRSIPERCACGGPLRALGVGTEKVEAELAARFPKARVARLDRDAVSSADRLTELLSAFARRELDVMVGTQMVAKGHDFPGVTLVGVVLADTSLALPDFRAAERSFQLLAQVGGRAGRGEDPGRVLIQTYYPDAEPIWRARAHDFEGFTTSELERRRALAYPPFARMAAIRVDAKDPDEASSAALRLAEVIARNLPPASRGVRLLGPAPAAISRIAGRSRWQLLLSAPRHKTLEPLLAAIEHAREAMPRSLRVAIDVDPGSLL